MSQPFSRPGSLLWLARHEARLASKLQAAAVPLGEGEKAAE